MHCAGLGVRSAAYGRYEYSSVELRSLPPGCEPPVTSTRPSASSAAACCALVIADPTRFDLPLAGSYTSATPPPPPGTRAPDDQHHAIGHQGSGVKYHRRPEVAKPAPVTRPRVVHLNGGNPFPRSAFTACHQNATVGQKGCCVR